MGQASFKQKKRGDAKPSGAPDGGSWPRDSKLKVDKNSGTENWQKGHYEQRSELNRDQKSSIIRYQ